MSSQIHTSAPVDVISKYLDVPTDSEKWIQKKDYSMKSYVLKFVKRCWWLYLCHLPCQLLSMADTTLVYTSFNCLILFGVYATLKYFYNLCF